MNPILWLRKALSSFVLRGDASSPALDDHFVARLDPDEIAVGVEKVLGRRLTSFETNLIEQQLRPLRDGDDSLAIRVASPRYEGGRAPVVFVRSLAISGYAAMSTEPLTLVESATIARENPTAFDEVVDIVA